MKGLFAQGSRAIDIAMAAFGARIEIEELLPGKFGDV